MQAARPNPLDLNNATPRRVPKLAVRNRSSDESAVIDTSQSSEESHGEIQPVHDKDCPSSNVHRVPSKPILKNDQRHQRHDSKDSNSSEKHSRGRQPNKRKSAGVLGFLTLKEPSTYALDQFAEHERKKAAQKGAKSVAAVIPGVSSQKLPDHVPKVNSKWDGLPEGARRKSVDKRSSIISIGSASRAHSPRRPYGSMSSKPHARRSQEKKRNNVHVTEIEDDRPMSGRSMYSPPPPSATHPALRRLDEQTFLHSPSHSPSRTYLTSPELELPELPPLQSRDYSSGTATSPDASPRTPAFDSTSPMAPKIGHIQPLSNLGMDATGTFYLSDSDDVIVKTAGPDVLRPPGRVPNLRSTRSASRFDAPEPIAEEVDAHPKIGAVSQSASPKADSRPGLVRNFSHVSKYCHPSNSSGPSNPSSTATTPPALQSPAFSAAASESTRPTTSATAADRGKSISPIRLPSDSSTVSSGLSAQWASPSKDRLSLGPQIKKNEVLPWEMFDPPPEQPTTLKTTPKADSSKLKRLSHKLGKK